MIENTQKIWSSKISSTLLIWSMKYTKNDVRLGLNLHAIQSWRHDPRCRSCHAFRQLILRILTALPIPYQLLDTPKFGFPFCQINMIAKSNFMAQQYNWLWNQKWRNTLDPPKAIAMVTKIRLSKFKVSRFLIKNINQIAGQTRRPAQNIFLSMLLTSAPLDSNTLWLLKERWIQ